MQAAHRSPGGTVSVEDAQELLGDDGVVVPSVWIRFKQGKAVAQPVGELLSEEQGTHRIGDMFGFVRCERRRILSPAWVRGIDSPPSRHAAESEERTSFTQCFLDPSEAPPHVGSGC